MKVVINRNPMPPGSISSIPPEWAPDPVAEPPPLGFWTTVLVFLVAGGIATFLGLCFYLGLAFLAGK